MFTLKHVNIQNVQNTVDRLDALSNIDDALEFDELAIARGEMDDLMESNPVLAHFGEHVLLHRMERIKKALRRAVAAKKMAYKYLKQYRKSRTVRAVPVGAHLMEQQFLGFIGKIFKKVARAVVKVVKTIVKVIKTAVKVVGGLLKV